MAAPRVIYADEIELRRRFNDGRYWERVQAGDLRAVVLKEPHPSPRRSSQPYGTRSQIVTNWDRSGQKAAIVHQYRLRDGRLGGS